MTCVTNKLMAVGRLLKKDVFNLMDLIVMS